jgi:hypothetical protein
MLKRERNVIGSRTDASDEPGRTAAGAARIERRFGLDRYDHTNACENHEDVRIPSPQPNAPVPRLEDGDFQELNPTQLVRS